MSSLPVGVGGGLRAAQQNRLRDDQAAALVRLRWAIPGDRGGTGWAPPWALRVRYWWKAAIAIRKGHPLHPLHPLHRFVTSAIDLLELRHGLGLFGEFRLWREGGAWRRGGGQAHPLTLALYPCT